MQTVKGIVEKVSQVKEGTDKKGNKYYIWVVKFKGNDKTFGANSYTFKEMPKEGDELECIIEVSVVGDKTYNNIKPLTKQAKEMLGIQEQLKEVKAWLLTIASHGKSESEKKAINEYYKQIFNKLS